MKVSNRLQEKYDYHANDKTNDMYGHFDILDSQWANIIHSSISKGTNNRDEVEFYHEEIAKVIEEL